MRQRVTILQQLSSEEPFEFEVRVQKKLDELQQSNFVESLIKPTWFNNNQTGDLTCILEYEQRDNLFNNVFSICVLFTPDLESVLVLEEKDQINFPVIKNYPEQTSFSTASIFFTEKIGVNILPGDWKLIGEMQKTSDIKQEIVAAVYRKPQNGIVEDWKSVGAVWMRINELSNVSSPKKMIATYGSHVLAQSGNEIIQHTTFKYSL